MNYTVSVIIPTYNRSHLLKRAIDSCMRQSYRVAEIIVVDDCSTDDTVEIMDKLVREDTRIIYIRLNQNEGAQAARIKGIETTNGDLIAFLDSDDELLPNSIEIRVNALRNSGFKEAMVVGLLENIPLKYQNTRLLRGYEYPYLLKEQVVYSYITILVNRSCFEVSGFPSENFPACQDDDMVLTVCKHFPILQTQQVVARVSEQSDSITYNRHNLYLGHKMLLEKYKEDMIQNCGRGIYMLWRVRLWSQFLLYVNQLHTKDSFWNYITNFARKLIVVGIRKSMALFFDRYYV